MFAPEVKSLDGIPETFHSLYMEDTDGEGNTVYKLDMEGVAKRLGKFEQVVGEKRKLTERLAKLTEPLGGREPDEVVTRLQELEAAEKERERKRADAKGDWEKQRELLESEHAEAIKKLNQNIEELETSLRTALIDTDATAAIQEVGGKVKPLLPHIRDAAEVIRLDDGTRVVRVRDPESPGEYRKNLRTSEPMTIKELVAEYKEDDSFSPLFTEPQPAGGGGTPPKVPGTPPGGRGGAEIVLSREDAKNPDKYRAAKAQAEEQGVDLRVEQATS